MIHYKPEEFVREIVKTKTFKEQLKKNLALAILGGRICYTGKDIETLLKENYFKDIEKAKTYLKRLAGYGHFSVFSPVKFYFTSKELLEIFYHLTPIQINTNLLYLHSKWFKSLIIEENTHTHRFGFKFTLRHLLESVNNPQELLEEIMPDSLNIEFEKLELGENENIYLFNRNDNFYTFVVEGFSRVMTHQLVRHSSFDFLQRSQRYVKEDNNLIYLDDEIKNNQIIKDYFNLMDSILIEIYNIAKKEHIHQEKARYILPCGRKTTILVSLFSEHFPKFYELRSTEDAQDEIRKVCLGMKSMIDGDF